MYAKRAITHPGQRAVLLRDCELLGVTPEHFLAVVAARKAYRRATMYRKRSRTRVKAKNAGAARNPMFGRMIQYSGEGELHPLIRQAGFTIDAFCKFAGIAARTFYGWYGHPMHRLPIVLLEHYIWARNMAEALRQRGVDPEQFKAAPLPPAPTGRYPRTAAQAEAIVKGATMAAMIDCPIHGSQRALGGECPLC